MHVANNYLMALPFSISALLLSAISLKPAGEVQGTRYAYTGRETSKPTAQKMKAFLGRTASTLGAAAGAGYSSLARGYRYLRRTSQDSESSNRDPKYELDSMTEGVAHTHVRRGDSQDESSDSRSPSPLGKFPNPDEDEVLYRKNNVQLKYPASARRRDSSRGGSPSDVHIPGFLFITTRGSNFGSTLILNWAPNSSMRVPSSESTGGTSSASDASDSGFDAADRPSCSSVSIDLGLMEIIRIFYHADESGYIISGEMVIRSKDRTFKVCCV